MVLLGGWLLLCLGRAMPVLSEGTDAGGPGGEELSRGSVLLITVTPRAAWPENPDAAVASLAADDAGSRWWMGTSWAGSTDPLRALFGLLSGIPPYRVRGAVDEPAIRYGLAHRMQKAGHPAVGRIDGPLAGGAVVGSLVPAPGGFVRMRAVLQELEEAEGPFFYWLSFGEAAAEGEPEIFRRIPRMVRALRSRGLLEETLVVVTSLAGGEDGRVPLLVRLPPGLAPPPETVPVALESVGATLLRHAGFEAGPAAYPTWGHGALPAPLLEQREGGELTGLVAVGRSGRVEVEWRRGRMRDCWHRDRPLTCRWATVGEEVETETVERLESAVLLALEGLLGS